MANTPATRAHVPLALEDRAAQLSSLLQLVHGQGCEAFNGLSEVQRDNILWLASDLAEDIRVMVNGPEVR
jgi:DNA/RNA-binding domain of Phe-tRNA-synthetase-like protein